MLSPEKRAQLDGIVMTMAKQNASQFEVQSIVNDFKAKHDVIEQPIQTEKPQQGLVGKLAERGKNISAELKPKKDTSTYEKISNVLGGKMVRTAGQVAGAVGDVIGAGLEKGYEKLVPESVKENIKQAGVGILKTQVGQAGLDAIQGGVETYQQWKSKNPNAAKDLEAVVNIAALLPVGKGAGMVAKPVAEATAGARKSVAKTIVSSAEKNVSEALAPTTKKAKALTEKITPEFMEKGIVGSRETILKKAEEGVSQFGEQIKSYLKSDKLVGEVPKSDIILVIDDFAKSGMTKSGVVVDTEKVGLAEKMRGIVSEFGDNIPADEAKSLIQIIGDMVERKGGWNATGSEKLAAKLEKNIYGTIAGELAKSNPDLDRLNKAFNFYSNLQQITQETISRTKPQSGMFKKAAATLFAGQGQGVLDTAIKYIGSKLFLDFVSGPFYKTLSAKIKTKLAKAIYSGDVKGADTIIKAVKDDSKKVAKTILDKNIPVGMSIEDVSGGKPGYAKTILDSPKIEKVSKMLDAEDVRNVTKFVDEVLPKSGSLKAAMADIPSNIKGILKDLGIKEGMSNEEIADILSMVLDSRRTIISKPLK